MVCADYVVNGRVFCRRSTAARVLKMIMRAEKYPRVYNWRQARRNLFFLTKKMMVLSQFDDEDILDVIKAYDAKLIRESLIVLFTSTAMRKLK